MQPTDLQTFRESLHQYNEKHGEVFTGHGLDSIKALPASCLDFRVLVDSENIRVGSWLKGSDGNFKCVVDILGMAGAAVIVLVGLPDQE